MKTNKDIYNISKQNYRGGVTFWCGESFEDDDNKVLRKYYTKNDCFHKVKELRKGYNKEDKKLINVW